MKLITTTNWILVGLYGLLLLFSLVTINRSGNDAAGRGVESGLILIGAFLLVALIGLNLMPQRAPKLIGLVLAGLPLLILLYNLLSNNWISSRQQQEEQARANGSFYFQDPERQQLAAAIVTDDIPGLGQLLRKKLPQLNKSGNEHITLLDFATLQAASRQASSQPLHTLNLLLSQGATLTNDDSLHKPTHLLAGERGSADLLEFFLKKGADPNARDNEGAPLLFSAITAERDPLEKVKKLLAFGADPNAIQANSGLMATYSPLLYAAYNRAWDICLLLLDKGADPTYRSLSGYSLQDFISRHEPSYSNNNDTPAAFITLKNRLSGSR